MSMVALTIIAAIGITDAGVKTAVSIGSFTHWMFCATLTFVFPLMTAKMPTWSIFALFGTFMVFHIFWAIFIVPETKGKVLEEIKL